MKINNIIEQAISGLGYELVEVELTPASMIRVFMDKEGGVTIEDCQKVSEHLSRLFMVEGVDYNRLEVSSPGLERPLKKFADFVRFSGKSAKIKTINAIANEKVFYGLIVMVDESNHDIHLQLNTSNKDGSDAILIINYANVSRARLVFEYKKSPQYKRIKKPDNIAPVDNN